MATTRRTHQLTEPWDVFAHPFWDTVRGHASQKSMEMRRHGFVGAAMVPMNELEHTGIVDKLKQLDRRFIIRSGAAASQGAA